jgi:hypothetical protein
MPAAHENPTRLLENSHKAFLGMKIYGQGFLFDDADHRLAEQERRTIIPPGNSSHISPAEIVAFDWDQYDRRR